ncbi:MAG: potassium channel protein, partial [Desulfobacterales bacterium]|nr:potassium channel protein [Desulfobacterales bacterium]
MENTKHLITGIIMALGIVVFGTAGYMLIEDWELFDALYMTVITVSTVGFSEVHQISKVGRLFTIMLVFFGVGFSLYIAAAVVQFMVEGRIRLILGRRRLEKKINRMKNHYIVCGYGRIGRVLCKNLKRKPFELVVIEKNPELIPVMDTDGVLY